jgi:hypothetical protein
MPLQIIPPLRPPTHGTLLNVPQHGVRLGIGAMFRPQVPVHVFVAGGAVCAARASWAGDLGVVVQDMCSRGVLVLVVLEVGRQRGLVEGRNRVGKPGRIVERGKGKKEQEKGRGRECDMLVFFKSLKDSWFLFGDAFRVLASERGSGGVRLGLGYCGGGGAGGWLLCGRRRGGEIRGVE